MVQQQKNTINDDWTRNWQARVAIKITAIFLWVIILTGFGAVIYFTQDLERHIEREIARELDGIAYQIDNYLETAQRDNSGTRQDMLRSLVEELLLYKSSDVIEHSGITGVKVIVGKEVIEVGDAPDSSGSMQRPLAYKVATGDELLSSRLEGYFLDFKSNATATRQQLIISVVIVLLLFGMLLSFTIQQVLSKPFNILMDAIQGVSNGDLDLRLDVSREDEFGHLSRFFNQMLDRVRVQQTELTEANRELISEISVRKQAEQSLRANQDQLEKLVEERTRDLAIARDQALAASQTKSAFIANISHEIRTPLTPIIGFAEALLHGNESEQNREQLLRTIIRNGKHLSHIINEILDLSKIEASSLKTESIPVNVFEMLVDVRSVANLLAQEKGLEFDIQYQFPLPSHIVSDPTRIKQILMNLVTNAMKFTERGQVTISARYREESRQLELAIVDTGIGIAKDVLEKLFKPFSQADYSTTRQFGGTGLGLYISKRLALLLGGDITLDSVAGVGTRCTVTLSIGDGEPDLVSSIPASQEQPAVGLAQPVGALLHGHVLLAEDSPDIQRLMVYVLRRAGVQVTAVENGALAVEAALANDYQLILMDMQMPVMGGLEAVELLRASGCSTPIVALTANAMKEDQKRYHEVGCDAFLSKPVDQDKMQQILQDYLVGPSLKTDAAEFAEPDEDEAYKMLVRSFLDGLEAYSQRIATALDETRFDVVRDLAHQLKGLGGSFGYPEITERAAYLETAIRNGNHDDASGAGRSFISLLEATRDRELDLEAR